MAGTVLLERDELLEELAAAGVGRLVFVGGEAGVGKTSLVRAFCDRTDKRVLHGICEALTTPTPLGPFVDLVGQVGGGFGAKLAAGAAPREVALALAAELDRPTVVVLEDVHWADEASLDVLRVLGRRVDGTKALVLATYRQELSDDHPLRVVLGELASTAAVTRVTVAPLSLDAVRTLAEPQGVDAESVFAVTRGNPFYVTEVLAAGGTELPSTVRDAVLARAASLDPAARRLLEVAAVVPARAELWLLERVAADEMDALGTCISFGMLREEGDAIAFRHELARLAIESAIPPHRRRALHAAMLSALSRPSSGEPDDARLAHHAEEAGDEDAVLKHARAAAERAARLGAHREAASQYARARRHADRLERAERAALLAAYAHEAQLTGRYEQSLSARLEAIALCRELGDRLGEGENLSRVMSPYVSLGRNAEAEDASRLSVDVLEAHPESRELAFAYTSQASLRMLNRDNYEGVDWGGRAPRWRRSSPTSRRWRSHSTSSGRRTSWPARSIVGSTISSAAWRSRARTTSSTGSRWATRCSVPGSGRCTSSSAPSTTHTRFSPMHTNTVWTSRTSSRGSRACASTAGPGRRGRCSRTGWSSEDVERSAGSPR